MLDDPVVITSLAVKDLVVAPIAVVSSKTTVDVSPMLAFVVSSTRLKLDRVSGLLFIRVGLVPGSSVALVGVDAGFAKMPRSDNSSFVKHRS